MSSFKLSKLLLERASTKKPGGCGSNAAVETNQSSYGTYQLKPEYVTWTESDGGFTVYYYYCKKSANTPPVDPNPNPVVSDKCPSEEGYVDKEFQEWVWKTYLGKTETDTVTTKLCGIKNGKAKTCAYSVAVGSGCGDGTKAVWKELKDKFIEFKKGGQNVVVVDPEAKKKECLSQGMDYDETTKNCVAKKQEVDPDAQQLVNSMEQYRTILNSFYDPTGWINVNTLSPSEYVPNFLSLKMLTQVTKQIVELINQKGSSSDFGSFVEMMETLKISYNVEKYKDFFQKKVDPTGTDVFGSIDTLINEIKTSANESKTAYGYDPLTSPTEKQIRDFVFRGQLRSVYKSGKLNLMMMVYTYTDTEPLKTNNKESVSEITSFYNAVSKNRNFDNCKNILGIYRETYQEDGVYSPTLLVNVKTEIQRCWCDKQYEDLGKLGVKNMFDKQLRQDRKALITFLNQLPSATMGDFAVRLNSGVCTKNKSYK
jgi:hypothetical protein